MLRKNVNSVKHILILASLLAVFFSHSVNAQSLPLLPDGIPQGYETWPVVYDFPNRTVTMDQKLDADFWKQNLSEPIPPIWWFNEVLGTSYPDSSPYDQQIADAEQRGDWATVLELKQKYINELGITADQQAEVTNQWFERNPYHNLSYFALGVRDKKTRTFMSNQNPDDPSSPFAKEGENIMVVEVLEDNVSGTMDLTNWDIVKIGLFEKGYTLLADEDYIRGLVERAQRAKFFLGVSRRENGWESYAGYKVGGIFGMAMRTMDSSPPPSCTASVSTDRWRGEYYSNRSLSGTPSMVRDDGNGPLNFEWNWSAVSATCGIGAENFSVRWTRDLSFNGGTYRFSVTGDDGVRLYVDGILQIDRWIDQGATTYTADIPLSAGNHYIVMEYYQHLGGSAAKLSWQQINSVPSSLCTAPVSTDRWRGEYYNNTSLSGTPSMVRDDGNGPLNFEWNWSAVSATCGIGAENFSVRWTRDLSSNGATYRFSVTGDDGVRLYVDGILQIDRWIDQGATTYTADIPLSAGNHYVVMEYYQHLGGSAAKLSWQQIN
jgi:hypothetical protein